MKNRILVVAVAVLLLASLTVMSCAKPAPTPAPAPAPKPAATPAPAAKPTPAPAPKPAASPAPGDVQRFLRIGAPPSGVAVVLSANLSTLLNKYTTIKATSEKGAGMAVYPLLNSGELDVIPLSMAVPLRGYQGIGVEKTRLRDLSAAGFPALTVYVVVTRPDSGIKALKDLKGKTVAHEPAFPYYVTMLVAAMKANGLTDKDITFAARGGINEAASDVVEKRVAAAASILGSGTQEIQQSVGAIYIPFTAAEQKAMNEAEPAFMPYTVPKGYRGMVADIPQMAAPFHLLSRAALNDITAYTLVKTLYDNIAEFSKTTPGDGFKLETALSHMVIPVHPGAIRYYKEKGVWTAQHDTRQNELLAKEKTIFGN